MFRTVVKGASGGNALRWTILCQFVNQGLNILLLHRANYMHFIVSRAQNRVKGKLVAAKNDMNLKAMLTETIA